MPLSSLILDERRRDDARRLWLDALADEDFLPEDFDFKGGDDFLLAIKKTQAENKRKNRLCI